MTENPGAKYAISDVCGALDRCKDFLGHYMENMQGIDAAIAAKREELAGVQREIAVACADLKKAQDKHEELEKQIKKWTKQLEATG
jgi:septal ring factor EnvC (AmiA/AmiB activator)